MKLFAILLAATMLAPAAGSDAAKPAKQSAVTDRQRDESSKIIADFDFERLTEDDKYARLILLHAERLTPDAVAEPERRDGLVALRTLALMKLGRAREGLDLATATIATGTAGTNVYGLAILAAAEAEDPVASLPLYEKAAALPAEARAELRAMLPKEVVDLLWRKLWDAKNVAGRQRFAEALLTLGWPDEGEIAYRDFYRSQAIDGRIARGDIEGARALAAQIVDPSTLGTLLVARKYDALFPPDTDRAGLLQASLAGFDRATRERAEAMPEDAKRLLQRGNALRALGREAEALSLFLPFASDLKKVEAAGESGYWIVNDAALTLGSAGRHDEALALMDSLLTLGVDKHTDLVSMAINYGEMLNVAGRFKEAAAYETKLTGSNMNASPYGFMWTWSIIACAHALSGDAAAAAPWLDKLRANSSDNQAAHMRALLCANDLDSAEKLLVSRLRGDAPEDLLLKLQDYRLGTTSGVAAKILEPRLLALRERPAVRQAIGEVGRVMSLPLSKTYWGDY
ncbi:MAG TPA: hypothetical protein VGC35_02340 [Allosphingosinicella sp.]|jgi:tetratricopeptide (TPR) repeat protein